MSTTPTQHGFTLVETLVAITILLIVVTGPLTISMSTARSTTFASEQVVAFFLAQEGAELAQKARDELFLEAIDVGDPSPWGDFTDSTAGALFEDCFKVTGCGLELETNPDGDLAPIVDCGAGGVNCRLYADSDTTKRARYTYDDDGGANEATPYTRIVRFTDDGDEVKVESTVTWRTGNLRAEQRVKVETYLFDVYEN